jgi:antitoxin CptB
VSELARLRWKCRRGMLELDLLLRDFMENGYAQLDAAERACFERLLDYPDAVLIEWLMGRTRSADKDVTRLVEKIRAAAAG